MTVSTEAPSSAEIAREWLFHLDEALARRDVEGIVPLLLAGGYWRDLLALTWDLRTMCGREKIGGILHERLAPSGLAKVRPAVGKQPQLVQLDDATTWIEAFFDFETAAGLGRGVVRLVRDEDDGEWKAWTLLTSLEGLKEYEPAIGDRRPLGHSRDSGVETHESWLDRRGREREFEDCEPAVLVVGAGQAGLVLAAQLGLLGVDTLVVEKNPRVGDNWRNRYHSLVLHDPVWADHLPYLPFPPSWPVYTPKDKLADWLEFYASAMELNVWTGSELLDAHYDDSSRRWTLRVRRADGNVRTLSPSHVVMATGTLSVASVPALEGADAFRGTLYHSMHHETGKAWTGRKAVVVGACNSGHDIAQDLYENGADVTLVQRSSTYVLSQKHGIPALFGGLYHEGGPATEDADLLMASYPLHVALQLAPAQTKAIAELDRELLDGLERAGFKLDMGIGGGGLWSKALRRAGGYYIDVGCSQLIADGKIKVKQGAQIERLDETSIVFDDGSTFEADLIVLATGFENMREGARALFGDSLANRVRPVWDVDEEGELNTIWRDSGHPGFWFTGGSLALVRIYSKYLAFQIKAITAGLIEHPAGASRA